MEVGINSNNEYIFKQTAQITCTGEGQLSNITYQGLRIIFNCCKERKDSLTVTVSAHGGVKET